METIIKAHIKHMEVTRNSTSFPLGYRTDYTTILELEGSIPIDPTRPITICQEEPTNDD